MFVEEMQAQPNALRELVSYYSSGEGRDRIVQAAALARDSEAVTFTGMGSSLYASYAVLPALRQAGWRANPQEAGEILHYGLPGWRPDGPLIAVSQSGESAETLALADALQGKSPLIAVTNDPESSLARAAQIILPLHAGTESAISTKTYTNTLGIMHLLKAELLGEDLRGASAQLTAAAGCMEECLRPELEDSIREAAAAIDAAQSVHFLGRGPALAATFVSALIIGEGARVTAVGLPAGSFRHGPFELADERHAALLFLPNGPTRPLMEKLWGDLARVGSHVIALTETPNERKPSGAVEIILSETPTEAHFPFVAAIGVERILAAVAERRGLTPGQFRYGGKVTSEE